MNALTKDQSFYRNRQKNNHRKPSEENRLTPAGAFTGIVIKKSTGGFLVKSGEETIACRLPARASLPGEPVVGDHVRFTLTGDSGIIHAVLTRRNWFSRRAAAPMPGSCPTEQVIVANVDQVAIVMAAAEPEPKWSLLDRFLVQAESHNLPALIVTTKLDLVKNGEGMPAPHIASAVETYRKIGYRVVLCSAVTGEGLDDLQSALRGCLTVLLGKSGVGKTSLLNALEPGLGLRVNKVNQTTHKGRHTTTHLEMFNLPSGGDIVDTPGIREFGLWDIPPHDLAFCFPEMRPYLGRCRFGQDCHHDEEPGCAVRRAVVEGAISPYRYHSYTKLIEDP